MPVPVEPPPTRWELPDVKSLDGGPFDDLVALGADLEPGTLLAAYRTGIFPMPADPITGQPGLAWWSPDPRGVIPLGGFHVSQSLARARKKFEVRVNSAFSDVVAACADPSRPGAWITADIKTAYERLYRLGWAHSIEAWTMDGKLAGGVYGIALGGFFAGESMFHARASWGRDASKVALAGLVDLLGTDDQPGRLLDVQWGTPHLVRLGAVEIPRVEYLSRLRTALRLPLPAAFGRASDVRQPEQKGA